MNTAQPSDPESQAREWQAQELACDAERRGDPLPTDDAQALRQRRIARALRSSEPAALPADFARHVAALASARAATAQRLETALVAVLFVLLAACAARLIAVDGAEWLAGFARLFAGESNLGWALLVAACLAITALTQRRGPRMPV